MIVRSSWTAIRLSVAVLFVAMSLSCRGGHGHNDDHGSGHGHGHGEEQGHGEGDEIEPLAITKWTDDHELFVEFPPPAPNKPVRYHAHVTRLRDNHAATGGSFAVRFKTATGVAAETSIEGVARAGIFTPQGPAPAAGSYALEMAYTIDGKTDVFDCGKIVVATKPPKAGDEGGGAISFLKESQWKIAFATAWAGQRSMAKEIELPATVEPAASDQLTVGAPTGGRFFHNPKLALAAGLRIKKGDVVGTIAPTVAGDDFSRLQFAVEDARIAKQQTKAEIKRIKPLVDQGLLPRRRLTELDNALSNHNAKLKSARRRLGRVVAPGGGGGLVLRSTLAGVVSQVLVPNGEPVEPGTALLRINGTERLWIRARFVARPASELIDAAPAAVRLPSGQRIDLSKGSASFLSPLPVIDPVSRIATWVVNVAPGTKTARPEQSRNNAHASLRVGSSAVLAVRIGKPKTVLAVPTSAVIDINTRPYVFVQIDGESFDKRAVTLGDRDGDFIHLVSGIKEGDRIVTIGGFDVHLASLMEFILAPRGTRSEQTCQRVGPGFLKVLLHDGVGLGIKLAQALGCLHSITGS